MLLGGLGVPSDSTIGSTSWRYEVAASRRDLASAASRSLVRCFARPYQIPSALASTITPSTVYQNARRWRSGLRTGTYAGRGPRVTGFAPPLGLLFPLIAMWSPSSLAHESGHDDSRLVEQHHREHHREHRVRVRARRDERGEDRDPEDRPPAPRPQLGRRDQSDHREEDQDDRELEGDAERERHQHRERQEPIARQDRDELLAGEPEEEAQGLRQGEVGEQRAEREQHDRARHERDREPLLLPREPRHDERPELPQHDGERDEQAEEDDDLQLDEHGVDRAHEEQRALLR